MNEIVNKLLLAGDKFMSKIHLRQPWRACSESSYIYLDLPIVFADVLLKVREEYKNLKEDGS